MMRISVLVPTFRRPHDLARCLAALAAQTRPPDEVIVIVRDDDMESRAVLLEAAPTLALVPVEIGQPGVVQALNRGLCAATSDIVTITDDDAAPRADWLDRIERHFVEDALLGGLGGRDIVHENGAPVPARTTDVGRVHFFGRMTGNHHIGLGPARLVDHLKGVNMSWRRSAIEPQGFDTQLRGTGAQVYFELAASLAIAGSGWRIKYDPAVLVDHYPAPRFDEDQRGEVHLRAVENASFNLYRAILDHMQPTPRRTAAIAWELLIGGRHRPGLLRAAVTAVPGGRAARDVARAAFRGRRAAAELHRAPTHR